MAESDLQKAKSLIQQKRYTEARKILKKLDDPTAKRWLTKLDEIAPPRSRNAIPFLYILGLGATLLIGIGIGVFLLNQRNNSNQNTIVAADLPTLITIPSATATSIPTNTFTPEPTPTFTLEPTLTPTYTETPLPTNTPTITSSPTITNTRTPTRTPLPTRTRIPPTSLPTPVPPQMAQIGPIYDSLYDETYNVQVALQLVRFTKGEGFQTASSGHIFVVANLLVVNLGPGSLRSMSQFNFQIKDGNGAIRNTTFFLGECDFPLVDLPSGGSVSGCVAFEVPDTGSLEIIYAPFQYEGLQPGRYISFLIR